ncbi:MAG: tripartite tricarboxylate transporter permease [Xanthobacteraceae bacterium]
MEQLAAAFTMLVTTPIAFFALAGLIWGIVGGALPGISASITMALILPFTFTMDPVNAIVLLSSVYIGAEYGGSIPAILIRTPGTNSAAATVIDGYEMKRQGRAGEALGISLWSGVIGSLFGLTMLVMLTEPLARVALLFTPMAYFALGILGLSIITSLSGGSLLKGLIAAVLGVMVATVGTDPISGVSRFVFGLPDLLSGIKPILIMIGLFAVSELMRQSGIKGPEGDTTESVRVKLPSWLTMRKIGKAQGIGCVVGTFEGLMPGGGGSIAAFLSYNEAKRWSRYRSEFGRGSVEGIAAPEASNNTVASTALIPLLSFGIPGSNSTAVLLGGLLIHGLLPGPRLFEQNADVILGLYTGSFFSIVMQLLVGIIILPICIWLVNRPRPYLAGFILALVLSGIYTVNGSIVDVWIVLSTGLVGYLMVRNNFPFLPAILGVVMGPIVESNYRRSLLLSAGDHSIFVTDSIALGLLITSALFIGFSLVREIRDARAARQEAQAGIA